jgi:hypothetical protein
MDEKTPSKTWMHATSSSVMKGIELLEKEINDLEKQKDIESKTNR